MHSSYYQHRLATVIATGRRYLVQNIRLGATDADSVVHCYGAIASYRSSGAATHELSLSFARVEVEVRSLSLVERRELLADLFEEHGEALVRAGLAQRVGRRGNYRRTA